MIRSVSRLLKTCAVGVALAAATSASAQGYPNRPITLVVPWGAGGGTDATARIVASLLEKDLGQPINVVNRTGGSGVVGHQAIASAAPDGYTIGMITVEITMMHHQKLTDLNPASYTPLALMNLDPAGFQVRADSSYKSMADVVAAIKANPGKFKASGTGQGGIWHLALAGMLSDLKINPATVPWVPSNGAAPGLQDLVAGGVEFVPCSLPEARSLIDAGKVRSLAVMDAKRASLFPAVPTLKEAVGSGWTTGAWRGIAAPKGLPADVRTRLETALKKVYDSKDYQDFMSQRGFGVVYGNGDAFAKFMAKGDADMKTVMTAVGIVKRRTGVRSVDRRVGIAIGALALVVLWTARSFPDVPGQALGASTLPTIVGAGLLACGVLLVLRGTRDRRGAATAAVADAGPAGRRERTGPALAMVGAIGLYLVASEPLGYLVVAPPCVLIAMRALRVRWSIALAGSVAASVLVHLAFYKLLKVPLPWGVVPVLY